MLASIDAAVFDRGPLARRDEGRGGEASRLLGA